MPTENDTVVPINERVRSLREGFEEIPRLKHGDGGGNSGGMDDRVSRLESRMDKLSDDLTGVREELSGLKERVSNLPSKDWIDARLLVLLTLIAALIAFGEKLQTLVK